MWHGDILHKVHTNSIVAFLGEPNCKRIGGFRRKELIPMWHGMTFLLTWRLILRMMTLGLRCVHGGAMDLKEFMA